LKNWKTGMLRYLLVVLWPAGEAAIAAATVNAVRRASHEGGRGMGRTRTAGLQQFPKLAGAVPRLISGAVPILPPIVGSRRDGGASRRIPRPAGLPDWVPDVVGIGVVTGAGGALAYKVMELLGPTVINQGPVIDEPIYHWTVDHQVKWWGAVIERLNKIGNSQPSWGAAGAAAATLAVAWPRRKWVPPAALGAAFVVERCVTLALRRKFGRPGPPDSPLGTYPSGGVDRVVYLYGLIAYLLWREFSGSPQGKAWAIGAVAALSFNEVYSREYLSKHWFSDILSGLLYGAILLAPSIAAVRLFAGPAVTAGQESRR
jgi:membrane-associated phospholipid phosphatase